MGRRKIIMPTGVYKRKDSFKTLENCKDCKKAKKLKVKSWAKCDYHIKLYNHGWHMKNREKLCVARKKYYNKSRVEVLGHYSKGKFECACCGENIYQFLTLDHING